MLAGTPCKAEVACGGGDRSPGVCPCLWHDSHQASQTKGHSPQGCTVPLAEQGTGADAQQPPLLRRCGCWARLTASVRSSLLKNRQGETNIDINDIIEAIRTNRVRISDHADEETAADQLLFDEIFLSVLQGEIIEDYPTDKPYPSCLIYGQTFSGEPVHSVWAYNAENQWAVLITVYRPDPNRWIAWRERKK